MGVTAAGAVSIEFNDLERQDAKKLIFVSANFASFAAGPDETRVCALHANDGCRRTRKEDHLPTLKLGRNKSWKEEIS